MADKKTAYEKTAKYFTDKGCKLLTTQEDFIDTMNPQKVKFVASCGHENEVFTNVFIYRDTGVICKDCMVKKQVKISRERNVNYFEQGHEGYVMLQSYIGEFFEMKKTHEGCLATCAIRPKQSNNDSWLSVELKVNKTIKFNMCSFHITSKYTNCLIVCVQLDTKKIWVIDGNIDLPKKLNITQTYSKYDEHLVSNDKLVDKFQDKYESYFKDTFENIDTPINENTRTEQMFKKIREEKIELTFEYPEVQNSVCDFTFENKRFQEKVGSSQKGKNGYTFSLHKNNGRNALQSYVKGDNDIYWLHLPDKKTFYVIPERVMIENELVSLIAGQKKKTLYICPGDENSKHFWTEEYKFEYDSLNLDELLTLIRS